MKRRLITLVTVLSMLVLGLMAPAMATKPGTDPGAIDGHKITICHATNSATNPYVVITIDVAAWDGGGEVRHSPDHHVNSKTGDVDKVWSEDTGCDEVTGPPTNT
jgi:hypothetical protein